MEHGKKVSHMVHALSVCLHFWIDLMVFIEEHILMKRTGPKIMISLNLSDEKNHLTCQYTGCSIGIPIMGYDKPYKNGQFNPLYTLTNQPFSMAHLVFFRVKLWMPEVSKGR